jgi:hypothetical protein
MAFLTRTPQRRCRVAVAVAVDAQHHTMPVVESPLTIAIIKVACMHACDRELVGRSCAFLADSVATD